jgi:hypothetical protein
MLYLHLVLKTTHLVFALWCLHEMLLQAEHQRMPTLPKTVDSTAQEGGAHGSAASHRI